MPVKRFRRFSDTALLMSEIARPEVLVAKIVSGPATLSSSANTFFFNSRSSGTASMIRSASFRSSRLVVKDSRASAASASAWVVFPRSTPRFSPYRPSTIVERDFSISCSLRSRTVTRAPPTASAWAMPDPITPPPITPMLLMSVMRDLLDFQCFCRRRGLRGRG